MTKPRPEFTKACRRPQRSWASACGITIAILMSIAPIKAVAQRGPAETGPQGSYINPFPPGDNYRLHIYGDWMGESLIAPLAEALQSEQRLQVVRKARILSPLVRAEHDEEIKTEETSREPVQLAVLFFGISDRVNFRASPAGPILRLGSEPWQAEYGRRVDRLLKALKKRGIAIYLVGQPPLRREEANTDALMLSEILRDKAFANGIRFIDITSSFVDDGGDYTQYGPDYIGNRQKLRDGDGVSITWAGNRKIAALIEKEIRRDMAVALAERAVPLAGAETEQRRINPDRQQTPTSSTTTVTQKDQKPQPGTPLQPAPTTPIARTTSNIGDQKAENSKITLRIPVAGGREETIATEIVRPAISAAVLALLTRREVSQNVQQNFDTIAAELTDGTTLSLVITPLAGDIRRDGRAGQGSENYNSVWIRGDRLTPKPGRADDFRWPPGDDIPFTAPVNKADTLPTGDIKSTPAALIKSNPKPNIPRPTFSPPG